MDAETAFALQTLAREQSKVRLLADINHDMTVCKIEGWDVLEYPRQLMDMIGGIVNGKQA